MSHEPAVILLGEAVEDVNRAQVRSRGGDGDSAGAGGIIQVGVQVTQQDDGKSGVALVFLLQDVKLSIRGEVGR